MKILHLNQEKRWVPVEKRYYDDEAHLQNLLAEDVNTLPFNELGYDLPFVTIGKEISLQNGSLDLLAISPLGHIALIETKLDKNPEVKRTVVGQILGYAAYLWNKSYEDLESTFHKFLIQRKIKFEGTLSDYIKEKVPSFEVSEIEFKEGLEKRLRLGSFSLLIVVDQVNQELKDIANYLNDRTGQEIDFYVMEMELIGDGNEMFLVPRLANPPRKNITFSEKAKTNDNYDRTPIAKDEFIKRLSPKGKDLAEALFSNFEISENVSLSWRKNGFSLMTKLPKKLVGTAISSNFSYLFFLATNNEELQFGYPEETFEKFPEIRPFIEEYVNYYRSIDVFKDKKITDLSHIDTKKITNLIKQTAQKLTNSN